MLTRWQQESVEDTDWMSQYPEPEQESSCVQQTGGKSRAAKKRQIIMQKQSVYNTHECRQQRNKASKARLQSKKSQVLEGMSKEQARLYFEAQKLEKEKLRLKLLQGQLSGLPILIDCVFQSAMNAKERKSLALQVQLIFQRMKQVDNPCSLHVCSSTTTFQQSLTKMQCFKYPLSIHKQNVLEVGGKIGKKLVYLSPDAPEQLSDVTGDTAYIIGGLVDRTILKNASLNRAEQLGVKAMRLPIGQWMVNRKCLNLDHVVTILVSVQSLGNWREAFLKGAPKRFTAQKDSKSQTKSNEQIQDVNNMEEKKRTQETNKGPLLI